MYLLFVSSISPLYLACMPPLYRLDPAYLPPLSLSPRARLRCRLSLYCIALASLAPLCLAALAPLSRLSRSRLTPASYVAL